MRPALTIRRYVALSPSHCARCGYPIAPFDAAYALVVGDVALVTHCSYRCAEFDAIEKKRMPLRVEYAA